MASSLLPSWLPKKPSCSHSCRGPSAQGVGSGCQIATLIGRQARQAGEATAHVGKRSICLLCFCAFPAHSDPELPLIFRHGSYWVLPIPLPPPVHTPCHLIPQNQRRDSSLSNCESPKPRKKTQRKTILPVCQGQCLWEAGPSCSPGGLGPSSSFAGAISKCYIECFSADSGAQKFQQGLDILTYRHREGRHQLWLEELRKDSPRSRMQGKVGTKKD